MDTTSKKKHVLDEPNVLARVAVWLQPHELLRAAHVSEVWRKFFKSPQAWEHFNVYGNGHPCNHYIAKRLSERSRRDDNSPKRINVGANLYDILTKVQNTARRDQKTKYSDNIFHKVDIPRSFIERLARLTADPSTPRRPLKDSHFSFRHLPWWCRYEPSLIYRLLNVGIRPKGLSDQYKRDKRAALATRNKNLYFGWNKDGKQFQFDRALLKVVEVARHVVAYNPDMFIKCVKNIRADPIVFIGYMEAMRFAEDDGPKDNLVFYWEARKASPLLLENREVVTRMVQLDPGSFPFLPKKFHGDKELARAAVYTKEAYHPLLQPALTPALWKDREFLLEVACSDSQLFLPLSQLSLKIRTDEDILTAVAERVWRWASETWHLENPHWLAERFFAEDMYLLVLVGLSHIERSDVEFLYGAFDFPQMQFLADEVKRLWPMSLGEVENELMVELKTVSRYPQSVLPH